MVNEKDLQEINAALLQGYEVYIRCGKDGVKIVAEKTTAKILKDSRKN